MTDEPTRLGDPFPPDALKSFTGRGGKQLTYVEDESVMDRLDAAYEVLHWSWAITPVGTDVVKGRLTITWVEGGESSYEDFGYASNQDGELLKEAATDAFRRVARMPGVARYVYAGKAPAPRAVPAARPTPQPARFPGHEDPDLSGTEYAPTAEWAEADIPAEKQCPIHHSAMRKNARGWFCPRKMEDGSWCPSRA